MWDAIQKWFVSKGGVSHVIAVLYLGVVAAYAAVPAFSALLNSIYALMPAWAHEVLLAAIGVIAWYKQTNSPIGNAAAVRADSAVGTPAAPKA